MTAIEAASFVLPIKIQDIQRAIPHRFPFLLVDRVIEVELEKRIVALKNVTINEAFFQGHFPHMPVMPGVLVLEAMAQAAGVLTRLSFDPDYTIEALFYAGIDSVRFRRMIVPGDVLRMEVDLMKRRSNFFKFTGKVLVDGEVATEAEFLLTKNQ